MDKLESGRIAEANLSAAYGQLTEARNSGASTSKAWALVDKALDEVAPFRLQRKQP